MYKIFKNYILNTKTNAKIEKEKAITKKGLINKRLIKYMNNMQPADINKIIKNFNLNSDVVYNNIILNNIIYDPSKSKFYKQKYAESRMNKDLYHIVNNKIVLKPVEEVIQAPIINEAEIQKQIVIQQEKNKAIRFFETKDEIFLSSVISYSINELINNPNFTELKRTHNIILKLDNKFLTLNDDIIDILLQEENEYNQVYAEVATVSGVILGEYIHNSPDIRIIAKLKVANRKPAGAYFTYYNETNIDLSRYEILTKDQYLDYDFNNNCLFTALKNGGLNDEKLNNLKTLICHNFTPIIKLNSICDSLKIKINLSRLRNDGKNENIETYGKNNDEEYNIGLINEHYFINEKTNNTFYSISNYDNLKDIKDYNLMYKLNRYDRTGLYLINSFKLITFLYKKNENNKYFSNIKYDDLCLANQNIKNIDFDNIIINNDDIRKTEIKEKKEDDILFKIFFDCETTSHSENRQHKAYCVAYYTEDNKYNVFSGYDCIKKFLDEICNNYNDKSYIELIAHNAKYDLTFLLKHLFISKRDNIIIKDNIFYSITATYYNKNKSIKLKITDSYKKIQMPLKDFGKSFKLQQEKEIMPYELYNIQDPIINNKININDCIKYLKNEDDKNKFKLNCEKIGCINNNIVDIIEYSKFYCLKDCEVLKNGYIVFSKMINDNFNFNSDTKLTISSVADNLALLNKCYDDTYELSGVVREFIQKTVHGGRVMTCKNEKIKLDNDNIVDFDAVSLYPSAMFRISEELGGYLKGSPKVLKKEDCNINFLNSVDGYFVRVKILDLSINRNLPLGFINKDGKRTYTNEIKNEILFLNKITLEDMIKFQGVKFEIINGVYYNEGRNNIIGNIIKSWFELRKQLKKDKNPAQIVYKLLLNSCYGKTVLKQNKNKVDIINDKDFDKFITYQYNYIKNIIDLENNKKFVVLNDTINKHFNKCHIGSEILAMSKRIMNEVICTAEDNNINIYYQDTDSMHIKEKDVEKLSNIYNKKYNKILIGEDMGQFHSDFELDGANDIKAKKSIFLGKKAYIDILEGEDINDKNKKIQGYHMRLKGIPTNSIRELVNILNDKNNNNINKKLFKNYYENNSIITCYDIYLMLYNGHSITFDLLAGADKFEYLNIGHIKTKDKFERTIKF